MSVYALFSSLTSRRNIGSIFKYISVIPILFCFIIYFDIFSYIVSTQTHLTAKARKNNVSLDTFRIEESIITDKNAYDNRAIVQATPQNTTFHGDFQDNGQSRKSVLSIPNNIKVSDFFESMHFDTHYSPFTMQFDYTQHATDWWKHTHNDTIPPQIVHDLNTYRDERGRNFARAYVNADYKNALNFLSTFADGIGSRSSFIRLANATVDLNGIVVQNSLILIPRSCTGCGSKKSCWNKEPISQNLTPQHRVDRCVTIAQYWGYGYYHFVGENLPRLIPVISSMRDTQNLLIHVHQKNKIVSQFLHFLNLDPKRAVSGNVFASELIVPEYIACGNTPAYLLHEMRNRILSELPVKNIVDNSRKCNILVIKRQTRIILNHAEMIKNLSYKFPWCSVVVHLGDEPLAKQLQLMADASVVIAPHGAGLVNMFVCHRNTLIIEFLNRGADINVLYMIMSLKLGLRYIGIPALGSGHWRTNKMIDVAYLIYIVQRYGAVSYHRELEIGLVRQSFSANVTTISTPTVLPESVSRLLPPAVQERLRLHTVAEQCLFSVIAKKYSQNKNHWKHKRHVTWQCLDAGCGGVGDRSKGIITAFLHALAIGYDFRIRWETPSQLYPEILVPAEHVDWTSDRLQNDNGLDLSFMDQRGRYPFGLCSWLDHARISIKTNGVIIPNGNGDCELDTPYVRDILRNQSLTDRCFDNSPGSSTWSLECMGCIWWYLFRIGVGLERALEVELLRFAAWKKAESLENAVSIGIHFRLGDSNMKAGKGRENDQHKLLVAMEKCALRVSNNISGPSYFVVASDSEQVRQRVQAWNWTRVYTTTVVPFHVDKTAHSEKKQGATGTISAFVDLFMLSLQDTLLLSGTSGYGYLARSIGRYNEDHVFRCGL